ncbi:MAG: hypothetical protein ABH856_00515 [Patescibacteria group bacterium]
MNRITKIALILLAGGIPAMTATPAMAKTCTLTAQKCEKDSTCSNPETLPRGKDKFYNRQLNISEGQYLLISWGCDGTLPEHPLKINGETAVTDGNVYKMRVVQQGSYKIDTCGNSSQSAVLVICGTCEECTDCPECEEPEPFGLIVSVCKDEDGCKAPKLYSAGEHSFVLQPKETLKVVYSSGTSSLLMNGDAIASKGGVYTADIGRSGKYTFTNSVDDDEIVFDVEKQPSLEEQGAAMDAKLEKLREELTKLEGEKKGINQRRIGEIKGEIVEIEAALKAKREKLKRTQEKMKDLESELAEPGTGKAFELTGFGVFGGGTNRHYGAGLRFLWNAIPTDGLLKQKVGFSLGARVDWLRMTQPVVPTKDLWVTTDSFPTSVVLYFKYNPTPWFLLHAGPGFGYAPQYQQAKNGRNAHDKHGGIVRFDLDIAFAIGERAGIFLGASYLYLPGLEQQLDNGSGAPLLVSGQAGAIIQF